MSIESFNAQISYMDEGGKIDSSYLNNIDSINKPIPDGDCVDLVDRAQALSEAINEYSNSNQKKGYLEKLNRDYFTDKTEISRISKSEKTHKRRGDLAFLRAYGTVALDKTSLEYFSYIPDAMGCADRFRHYYTGPGSKNRRNSYRDNLENQIETIKKY